MYPGTQIQLIDNSVVSPMPGQQSVTTAPLFATFFTSSRGPERFTILEGEDWNNTYLSNKTPDFYKDGQPLLQAARNITAGAKLFSKRIVADDALLASATVFIAVSTSTQTVETVTFTKAEDGALEVVANDTTDEDFNADTQIKLEDVTGITVEVGDKVNKTTTTETKDFINIKPILKSIKNNADFYKNLVGEKENLYQNAKNDITTNVFSPDTYKDEDAITNSETSAPYKLYSEFEDEETHEYSYDFSEGRLYPIFTIFDSGRGKSDKLISIVPNYSISKSNLKMIYELNVLDANKPDKVIESWAISFDPNVQNSSLKSLDIQTVISGKSYSIDAACYYEAWDQLIDDLKMLGAPEDIFTSTDMLCKKTLGGKTLRLDACTSRVNGDEKSRYINMSTEAYEAQFDINQSGSLISLDNGSFGSLPCMNKNPDVFYACMLDVLKGKFSRDIFNLDLYTFDCIFDANYANQEVKKAIQDLCTYRGDCVCFMDMGTNITNVEKIKRTMEWDGNPLYITNNFNDENQEEKPDYYYNKDMVVWVTALYYDIKNPYNNRQITVTATYSLSSKMVSHFAQGRERAFAGQNMGITIPEAIFGTINYIPKIYPKGEFTSADLNMTYPSNSEVIINEKETMCDLKVNYATYYNNILTMDTLYTTYPKDTALSYINNVMAAQVIIKEIRRCCPTITRYNFIDGDTLAKYQEDIQDRVFDRYSSLFKKLSFKYVRNQTYEENKIFYGVIQIAFKDFTQSEIFKVTVVNADI